MRSHSYSDFFGKICDNSNVKTFLRTLLIAFCLLGFTRCDGSTFGGTEMGSPSSSDLEGSTIATLAQGTDGDLGAEATQEFIDSQTDLQTYWEMLFPGETAPTVDFDVYQVAFVVMGEQSSSGYEIEVTSVDIDDTNFKVNITATEPGTDCITASVLTNPYHIAQIERSSLTQSFFQTTVTINCE